MQEICAQLSEEFNKDDYSHTLERIVSIKKLATGGNRNPLIHLKSIQINPDYDVQGKNFILLDDITTTGGSLAACAKILIDAGANSVICVALGRTTREQEDDE